MKKLLLIAFSLITLLVNSQSIRKQTKGWGFNGDYLGTNDNSIGSTDNRSFYFLTNGIKAGKLDSMQRFTFGASSTSMGSSTLHIARFTKGTGTVDIGSPGAGLAAIWLNANTPNPSNFAIYDDASNTYFNAKSGQSAFVSINATSVARFLLTQNQFYNQTKIGGASSPNATLDINGNLLVLTTATITGGLIYGTTSSQFLMLDNGTGARLAYNSNNYMNIGNSTGLLTLNGAAQQSWNTSGSALTGSVSVSNTFSATGTSSLNGIQLVSGGYSVTTKEINTTTGDAATINSPIGRFRKDTSGNTFVLTNSFITANSIITVSYASDPGVAQHYYPYITAIAGSATVTFPAAPSNDLDVNFIIMN